MMFPAVTPVTPLTVPAFVAQFMQDDRRRYEALALGAVAGALMGAVAMGAAGIAMKRGGHQPRLKGVLDWMPED